MVTDRRRLAVSQPSVPLIDLVAAAAKAGVDLIQVRERDLDAGPLTALVKDCVAAAAGTSATVLVNDRIDVAMTAGADGVHLRRDSIAAPRVRELAGADATVGQSIHSVEEAAAVHPDDLDYVILGAMFATASKEEGHPVITMTGLAAAAALCPVPVLAIGGVTIERAEDLARAGAAGVAAIGLFIPPADVRVDDHMKSRVTALRRVFDTCGAVP